MDERCTIDGTISQIVFTNEENGYTVLRLATTDGEVVTVVGIIPYAATGENLIVRGRWVNHPSHGSQIQAEEVERHLPSTTEDILSYLSSGVIRGIGSATAELLVQRFGERTLMILEEEPALLSKVKGISERKAADIAESYRTQTAIRRLLDFLSLHQLPLSLAMRLFRRYGMEAMDALRHNPYLLVDDRYGIDFCIMDEIALSQGISGDSRQRVEAAILFELSYNLGGGHVFIPRDKLIAAASTLIHCPADLIEISLDNLMERGAILCEPVGNAEACYLRRLYDAELHVTNRLESMLAMPPDERRDIAPILAEIEREQGITYTEEQRNAVMLAAQRNLLLLTGGAGTGKTTSVRGIAAILERMGLHLLLLAPTGRAAKRLGELCGRDAQTIHRCLGMTSAEDTGDIHFLKNEKELLDADAVIVDEMSMVDISLMSALLRALKPECRLILVGDADQLPSVGAGNVFSDLIRSERVETIVLKDIFRQAQESAIIRTAHAVNHGTLPELKNTQNSDFFFMRRRDAAAAVELVVTLCRTRLPENMGIAQSDIQVLCPTRKGEWGTGNLNRALQAALNPPAPHKRQKVWGDITFRTGDRVMQVRNDYDILWERDDGSVGTGMFNGDVGIVEEIDAAGELLHIRFDDRIAVYTAEMLGELELAYAITVHKSQGSEYRAVVFVALPTAQKLMVRGVLYTAITRAKELLVVVGDDMTLSRMTENDRQQRRYSGLCWRLRQNRRKATEEPPHSH